MCGPVSDYSQADPFLGTMCTDIIPRGDLNEYFHFPEDTKTGYVIVNDGPHNPKVMESEIEKITFEQQKWLQGFNVTRHEVDTVDSKFYNTWISYGLMDVTNMETGQELHYFYIVDELQVDSLTIGESAVAYSEADAAPKVASTKSLYTAFFIDSTEIMAEINGVKQDILKRSLVKMALVMTVATIILVILGQNRARSISDKMTKQVITLYENLLQISSNKAKGSLTLSYVPASAEMNELNLTYNQFAKIISLATTFEKHNSEKALLNYFEALGIFADFEDYDQQGKCLTNIGAIMMQKEDYGMAYVCFSESIEFMEKD